MKRILAACAVLAMSSFSSVAFAADGETPVLKGNIELYGAAKLSGDVINTDAKTAGADKTLSKVSSNSSRFGFKATEDLGNDLSAVMQLELGVNYDGTQTSTVSSISSASTDTTTGTTTVKTKSANIDKITYRNSYVGLSHKAAGAVLFGIHDTPYKMATASLDPFSDTMGDYNAVIGNVNGKADFDLRAKDTVLYQSAKWSGFQVMASTSATGQESATSSSTPGKREYSVSAGCANGPLFVSLGYEIHKNGYGDLDASGKMKVQGIKAGAGYTFDSGTKIGLVYEDLKDDTSASANTRNAFYVALSQKIGSETIKLAYGKADDGESTAETGAALMVVGIDHSFSKRTALYALYAKMSNDDGASYGLGQGGAGGAYTPAAGESPSVISIGINHSF